MSIAISPPLWATEPVAKPYRSRWPWFLLVGGGLFTAAGLLAWLTLWLSPPAPARLLVYTAGYETNLTVPQNAAGRAGCRDLLNELRSGASTRGRLRSDAEPRRFNRGTAARLLADLREVREPSLVLYFAAHGGADEDGPYLIPDDATSDPSQRLRLQTLLDALKELPAKTRKLVIFDATIATSLPHLGATHNGFAAGLERFDAQIAAVPNLCVFASSGPDERSWISPEWGMTTFGHFLNEGLRGGADANNDRRLDAIELIDFITPRVRDWARDHRAARQQPTLFPAGPEGRRRAGDIDLTVLPTEKRTESVSPPAPFTPAPELEQIWRDYAELAKGEPHPVAIAPGLWDEYTAWAVRYEQLTLAGSGEIGSVRERIADVRRRLADARKLELEARTQTLELSVGLGVDARGRDRTRDVVRLDEAAEPDRAKTWAAIRADFNPADPIADQLAVARALVRWVAEDPPTRLPRMPALLPLLEEGFRVRPAELHILGQLAVKLGPLTKSSPLGPVLRKVLELRLSAESTATGRDAAAVQPWIAAEVTKGDVARRQAEDLLFDSNEASWAKAATLATEAEAHFASARRIATEVANARAVYHRSAPALLGYAEWISNGPGPVDLPARMTREDDLQAAVTAWQTHHRLGQLLAEPPNDAGLVDLHTLSSQLETALARWSRRHGEAVQTLLTSRPDPTERDRAVRWWLAAESVLTVPVFGDADVTPRRSLLTEWRNVSRQLLIGARTRPEAIVEPDAAAVRERCYDDARRRGILALAAIGSEGFQLLPNADGYDKLRFRYEQFARQADARSTLATADGKLGQALFAVPDAIANRTTKPTDIVAIASAERLSRSVPFALTTEPAVLARKLRSADLLAMQATRTLDDYWSGGDSVPYYRTAALRLLADAKKLRTANRPEWANITTQAESDLPFPLKTQLPDRVVLTDEPDVTLQTLFVLQAGGGGRPGFITYRAEPANALLSARTVRPADGPVAPLVVRIPAWTKALPTSPKMELDSLKIMGFFRGDERTKTIRIERHPTPDATAVRRPIPDVAGVAVRVSPDVGARFGVGSGSLAFVLDASGSMRAPDSQSDNPGHYARAVDRFADILRQLPRGVSISVSVFGAREANADNPEAAFDEVLPFTDIARIEVDDLLGKLRSKEPWNKSAIVRAVRRARTSLTKQPEAYKAVILLSDCVDTRHLDDRAANPKKQPIADAIRNMFDGSGVSLHVVAYPTGDAADAAAQNQFRVVTELKPAGLFVAPKGADELVKLLVDATAVRVRLKLASITDQTSTTLLASARGADNWSPLRAGSYSLGLDGSGIPELPVDLRPGERLLVALADEDRLLRFRRVPYLRETAAVARSDRKPPPDWAFAALQNRVLDTGGLSLLAALEDADDSTLPLHPTRVGDVWFEVSPTIAKVPVATRWATEAGYPVPSWTVATRAWPTTPGSVEPASPTLTAWWQPDGRFQAVATWRPLPGTDMFSLPQTDLNLNGQSVLVESIRLETHNVEVKPGVTEPRRCIAVRMTSPVDSPMWVRPLVGVEPTGSEVRVYKAVNKSTSLFWWNDAATDVDLQDRIQGLDFVSLNAVKATATKNGHTRELHAMPPPNLLAPKPLAPAK